MRGERRVGIVILVMVALFLAAPVSHAKAADDEGHNPIIILGSVLTNIPYVPAKLVYCVLGGVTGALAYATTVGDDVTARSIWDATCRGTYVVTPRMLVGKQPIRFRGP